MKRSKLLLASLVLAATACAVHFAGPAICQTAGLIPTGNSSLPAGQYMLTNIRTGQAVYLEIDQSGRLLAQDPKALMFSVQPVSSGLISPNPNLNTAGNGIPADTTNSGTQQKGGMWGGLLRQGVESLMNKQQAPASQSGAGY